MGPTPAVVSVALPPGGRKGRAPKCPYSLGGAGTSWWAWAWRTPQSDQWDAGSLYLVGRRAQLEDSLGALDQFDAGWLAVSREMRELDDRLGLSPRALVALKWTIAGVEDKKGGLDEILAQRRKREADAAAAR